MSGKSTSRTPSSAASDASRSRSGPEPASARTRRGSPAARYGPHQRVEALLGREPRDGEDDDVVGGDAGLGAERVPPRRERVRRRGEPATSTVLATTEMRSSGTPRARIDSRASDPTTSTSAAPPTTVGTTAFFTVRRQPGLASRSFDSTRST